MRNMFRISGVAFAALALSLAACDSDSGTTGTGTDTSTDTSTGTDTTTGSDGTVGTDADATTGTETSTDDGTPDTTETDTTETDTTTDTGPTLFCGDPDPCAGVGGTSCDGDDLVVTSATCNEETDSCDMVEDSRTPCGEGMACNAATGSCVAVIDTFVPSEDASLVSGLAIGGAGEEEDCCFDFDGDDEIDNALGGLLNQIGGLLGADADINALVQEQIDEGTVLLTLEYNGLDETDSAADATGISINAYLGELREDSPIADVLAGTGTVNVNDDSFLPGTFNPLINFADASISSGMLNAGPSLFILAINIDVISLSLTISGATIEAPVEVGANGKGLQNVDSERGKLGGYVQMEDVVGALNAFADSSCGCLNSDKPLAEIVSEGKGKCNKAPADGITCDENDSTEGICVQLNDFCSAAFIFLKPDIDGDNNGVVDSLSLGAWIEMVSVSIGEVNVDATAK